MTIKDIPEVMDMLKQEGEYTGCSMVNIANTFICEDDDGLVGLFMMKIEQNLPSLRYFIVKRERRSMKVSRSLIVAYKIFCKKMGFTHSYITVKKDYLKRVVEYYFRKKPYAQKEGMWFYLVEV